ncbi:MAG TPA: acetyl-CoA carboxylase biotin carboxyl carrier protein [Thermopolyspora sp.]
MTADSMPDTVSGAVQPIRRGTPNEREELLNWLTRHAAEVAAASTAPLSRIRIKSGDVTVDVQWSAAPPDATTHPRAPATAGDRQAATDMIVVLSPMVGTFYRSPEPGAAPFVEVGDVIEVGQQVGIVEAMKLMNPIQAEHAGRVSEILATDGAPVEYGEPLIALMPHEAIGRAAD